MSLRKTQEKRVILNNGVYGELINQVNSVMNLTEKENKTLFIHSVPRFIAEIPFLANQKNPEVKAVLNLISYIGGSRNSEFFAQRKEQSISERIDTYINNSDGNREVLNLCRDILEEVSLYDHKNDAEEDMKNNHPNPLNRGEIVFKTEKRRLRLKREGYSQNIKNLIEGRFEGEVLSSFWLR